MTTTKLTHEELCELWSRCYWEAMRRYWCSPEARMVGNWILEMEDRYGQDED